MCWPFAAKPNSDDQHIGDEMVSRFVVVPGIPKETGSVRNGSRYYSTMAPSGYNIYDNKEKTRLPESFPTRMEAEAECEAKNSEQLFTQHRGCNDLSW
ncbi:hypothetical protein EMIT0P218_10845 [Pseudomonas sp. IT-P218]